jgi:hypothetical protein
MAKPDVGDNMDWGVRGLMGAETNTGPLTRWSSMAGSLEARNRR